MKFLQGVKVLVIQATKVSTYCILQLGPSWRCVRLFTQPVEHLNQAGMKENGEMKYDKYSL